jgi:hypothetical protein
LLAANPQISNAALIHPGDILNLPPSTMLQTANISSPSTYQRPSYSTSSNSGGSTYTFTPSLGQQAPVSGIPVSQVANAYPTTQVNPVFQSPAGFNNQTAGSTVSYIAPQTGQPPIPSTQPQSLPSDIGTWQTFTDNGITYSVKKIKDDTDLTAGEKTIVGIRDFLNNPLLQLPTGAYEDFGITTGILSLPFLQDPRYDTRNVIVSPFITLPGSKPQDPTIY